MFNLAVTAGAGQSHFLFKDHDSAEKARAALRADTADFVSLTDDFGSRGEFRAAQITSIVIEDMQGEAYVERTLAQTRTQVKAQARALADPALRMANAGLAINHPGGPRRQ